jgi:hypothetical protein
MVEGMEIMDNLRLMGCLILKKKAHSAHKTY